MLKVATNSVNSVLITDYTGVIETVTMLSVTFTVGVYFSETGMRVTRQKNVLFATLNIASHTECTVATCWLMLYFLTSIIAYLLLTLVLRGQMGATLGST